jgi:hypothetical protein
MPLDLPKPGAGKSMSGKKKATLFISAVAVGGAGIYLYRKHSAAASTTGTAADSGIDPNTGVPYADETGTSIDPNTGIPYADETAGTTPGLEGTYNPLTGQYTPGLGGIPGGNAPASNAMWAQSAESFLVSEDYDPATTAAALGAYLVGVPLTQAQYSIVQAAIAFEGQPPQGAPPVQQLPPGGQTNPPPGGGTGGGTPAPTGNVTVPNVVGSRGLTARLALTARGLKENQIPKTTPKGKAVYATSQSPKAGAKVARLPLTSDQRSRE